jgi:CPA1 family monovalent cation:H+ antiporter
MIASTLTVMQMMVYSGYALLITLTMVIVRILWVYGKSAISYLHALDKPQSSTICSQILREAALIGWSGMRGIVSLAAAIALPLTLPDGSPLQGRNEVIFITFIVILLTLLIPGLSLPTLLRWLNLRNPLESEDAKPIRKQLLKVAEDTLYQLLTSQQIDETEYDFLKTYFQTQSRVQEMAHEGEHEGVNIEFVRLAVIKEQRKQLVSLWKQKKVDDKLLGHLEDELDLSEVHIARAELD